MVPRDDARLLVDRAAAYNVPVDELADFDLTLVNESGSDESRWYTLRLLAPSNPDGAIVMIGLSRPKDYINRGKWYFQDKKLLNARLAWSNDDDTLEVALWGNNLLDEEPDAYSDAFRAMRGNFPISASQYDVVGRSLFLRFNWRR